MRKLSGFLLSIGISHWAAATPVFPGAAGFGSDTPAGRGGQVYKVTTLNEYGTGSLRECAEASGPRVCVFEIAGTIQLLGDSITIRDPYLTIAGQTAPSPGITLRGPFTPIWIRTHDVLIQHLHFRAGDDAGGDPYFNRASISIGGWSPTMTENIVIDHNSFSWATDQTVTIWEYANNITLSNNIFADPLDDSFHQSTDSTSDTTVVPHGYGPIVGGTTVGSVSFTRNLFANQIERNPLTRARQSLVANNLIYNAATGIAVGENGVDLSDTKAWVIGNVYRRGPDTQGSITPMVLFKNANFAVDVALSDFDAPGAALDPWDAVTFANGSRNDYEISSPPFSVPGFSALSTANDSVYDYVLDHAGARPLDRDSVDQALVAGVRDETSNVINCVSSISTAPSGHPHPHDPTRCASPRNAGGWPSSSGNERTLTLPADPDDPSASDPDYTNLEVWLQGSAAEVEGGGGAGGETVFSDVDSWLGDREHYTELTPERWAVTDDDDNLRYSIITTDYSEQSGSRLGEYALVNNATYGDFHFTAEVKSTENFSINAGADYDVVFGYQDVNNYYYMMFHYNASQTQLFKVVNGVRQTLATASQAAFADYFYHTIEVVRAETSIDVSVDGNLILSTTDSTFGPGKVGIGSFNDMASFDDITIVE
jgi:pectate lyase